MERFVARIFIEKNGGCGCACLNGDDATQPSYSHTYFLAQDGNKSIADASELLLTDAAGAGAAYMPQAGSKLIGAALLNGVTPVNYVGTFGAGDTWMDGWTNFDPNNTDY